MCCKNSLLTSGLAVFKNQILLFYHVAVLNPKLTSIEVIEELLSPVLFQLDLNFKHPSLVSYKNVLHLG